MTPRSNAAASLTDSVEDGETPTSRIPRFYKRSVAERIDALEQAGALDARSAEIYRSGGLTLEGASHMVENVVSTLALPNAVAVNFLINGVDRLVPMAVEEPSVVAAVSYMAKLTRAVGGFTADADASVMIGQIQLMDVVDTDTCVAKLEAGLPKLLEIARSVHPRLEERGGGLVDFRVRRLRYDEPGFTPEDMVVLHFHLDCAEAMGANMVNTLAEHLAPYVESMTGQQVGLKILSNLADLRLSRSRIEVPVALLGTDEMEGRLVAERIAAAWRFAWADPYRAATHNKGVMNGIDAVALATGNDWRAIEAGAHAWAAREDRYRPMTTWRLKDGVLIGSIEIPLQFGIVGGPIRVHPTVQANLALLDVHSARDLSAIAATVGLAQNLAALRALATEGIQTGHMRMHARTVAVMAGSEIEEVPEVAARLFEDQDFSLDTAKAILEELRRA